jgi:hypothetical protein
VTKAAKAIVEANKHNAWHKYIPDPVEMSDQTELAETLVAGNDTARTILSAQCSGVIGLDSSTRCELINKQQLSVNKVTGKSCAFDYVDLVSRNQLCSTLDMLKEIEFEWRNSPSRPNTKKSSDVCQKLSEIASILSEINILIHDLTTKYAKSEPTALPSRNGTPKTSNSICVDKALENAMWDLTFLVSSESVHLPRSHNIQVIIFSHGILQRFRCIMFVTFCGIKPTPPADPTADGDCGQRPSANESKPQSLPQPPDIHSVASFRISPSRIFSPQTDMMDSGLSSIHSLVAIADGLLSAGRPDLAADPLADTATVAALLGLPALADATSRPSPDPAAIRAAAAAAAADWARLDVDPAQPCPPPPPPPSAAVRRHGGWRSAGSFRRCCGQTWPDVGPG